MIILLPLLGLRACEEKGSWIYEPVSKASFVWFGETDSPITSREIWKQGLNVTRLVRLHRFEIIALFLSAKSGSFDDSRVRLGIAMPSGQKLYLDNVGGLRTPSGDLRLSEADLEKLKDFLPGPPGSRKMMKSRGMGFPPQPPEPKAFWKDEPVYSATFMGFGDAGVPITSRTIWKQGKLGSDVTRQVRLHRVEIMNLFLSARKGAFSSSEIRLGIAMPSGYTIYVDNSGGVSTSLGEGKLSQAQFFKLKSFLPKIAPVRQAPSLLTHPNLPKDDKRSPS